MKSFPTELEIRNWCVAYLARSFKTPAQRIDAGAKFTRLGIDSTASVFFVVELEKWLGVELPWDIVFDHPSPAELARHIAVRYLPVSETG